MTQSPEQSNTENTAKHHWSRSDRIALLALLISILTLLSAMAVPELRHGLGLDRFPQLQSRYTGTDSYKDHSTFPMQLLVKEQTEGGNIAGQIHFDRDQYSNCTFSGTVTTDNHLNLTCIFSDHQTIFNGYIYPDHHIQGTSTTTLPNDPYAVYLWNLIPSQ